MIRKINWPDLEAAYREGLTSNRELGRQFGCTETAIRKRATKGNWLRSRTSPGPQEGAPEPPEPPTKYPGLTAWLQRRNTTTHGPKGPNSKE